MTDPNPTPAAGGAPHRPLGDLNTAMRDLNLDADQVRGLVQDGRLVAFNIAVLQSGRRRTRRTELRILTHSLRRFHTPKKAGQPGAWAWPQVLRMILPHEGPELRGTEVRHALNCDRSHVAHLVSAGHLYQLRPGQSGRGRSCAISRASFEAFLKERLC